MSRPKPDLRIAGGKERDADMIRYLHEHSDLSRDGAGIMLKMLGRCKNNMERFELLTRPFVHPEAATEFLRRYDFMPPRREKKIKKS
jgi:hypothetical protein